MDLSEINLLKNLTLLLVEDDEELRDDLKDTLSIFLKNIFTAKNGKEALEIFTKYKPDLILTDYVMPLLDGYELCKEIRKTNKKIPLIIMSNYSDKEKLLKSISLELSDYLVKPIEYNQLKNALLSMAEKFSRENNLSYFKLTNEKKYDFSSKEIICNDGFVTKLTKSEVIILELLIKNANKIVTMDIIEYNLSPNEPKSEQAIKNIIHRLRLKLSKNSITNVQGLGYLFKSDE